MPKSSLQMLGSVGLFEGLSQKELTQIHHQAREGEFQPEDIIVTEGETGVGFHLILSGRAKVLAGKKVIANLGPGDFFGELSLIDRGPRTATVMAQTTLKTLSLVSWEFLPLLDRNPRIARKILVVICHRLRNERASHTH
ncbi:MAG: cyclic nucleotide-binding domain-containing protein [Actinomycetota bacterium]